MQNMFGRIFTAVALLLTLTVLTTSATEPISVAAGHFSPTLPVPVTASSMLHDWKLVDPYSPARPKLFTSNGVSFHLDPAWKVDGVESIYYWQGEQKNIYNHQFVESRGTGYHRDLDEVSDQLVADLIGSLSNLYPIHNMLAGTIWENGALEWSVELTGADAERILLYSSSTFVEHGSPWNVYYNGRIYAQYDGSLGVVLERLFPGERRIAGVTDSSESLHRPMSADTLLFATIGYPWQLSEGFVGLLPIIGDFTATVDRDAHQVTGSIKGSRTIPGYNTVFGTVTNVESVELLEDPANPIQCSLSSTVNKTNGATLWNFNCPLTVTLVGSYYDYPIRIGLSTMYESKLKTEGRIVGKFADKDAWTYIPAIDVQQMLAGTSDALDLLKDHIMYYANFNASATSRGIPQYEKLVGDVILLGETKVGSANIRYRVRTPFQIKDGKVVEWTLTRSELNRMLASITGLALTQRLVEVSPDLTLDLAYSAANTDLYEYDFMELSNINFISYRSWFTPCGAPDIVIVAAGKEPYRTFSYGFSRQSFGPDFVFINNKPVAFDLEIIPGPGDPTGLSALMLTDLTTADGKTFRKIKATSLTEEPTLVLGVGNDTDPLTRVALHTLAESLPGKLLEGQDMPSRLKRSDATMEYWAIEGATLAMTGDGMVEVVACTSARPTATPLPPTNTPNPTPAIAATPMDPSALSDWTLYNPSDPRRPQLILKNGNALRLKPDWDVDRIEYVYKWWGLSTEPIFDYQILERSGTGYQIGGRKIDPAQVRKLVDAISNLQPYSTIIAGQDHTDDYPLWHLELSGNDGQRIVLVSFSTANPGAAPWNIVYNGHIYAQLDGTLSKAIGNLFQSERGNPAGSFFSGGREPSTIVFASSGLPAQISIGFVGLLPIADSFSYQIDRKTPQIQGYIQGRSSIAGLGNMVIGTITQLMSVEVFSQGSKAVTCTLVPISSTDPSHAEWQFTCPLSAAPLNSFYDYPIKITFGTDTGQQVSTEGRLQGKVVDETAILYIPPLEIQQVLMANSAAVADLLTDHLLVYAHYNATVDAVSSKMKRMSGETILLGQAQIGANTIRYTIGTPFAIEDGKVTYWTLSRDAIQKMIRQIAELPLTRRIYGQVPDVTLNLWYAEQGEIPQVNTLLNGNYLHYAAKLSACDTDTASMDVVPGEEPFRAFGFGSRWDLWQADFLLLKDQAIVNELALWPESDKREGVLRLLVPQQLDWGNGKPFERIWFDRYSSQPRLSLNAGEDADPETIAALHKLVESLPGKIDFSRKTSWDITGVTIRLTTEGSLEVVSCSIK